MSFRARVLVDSIYGKKPVTEGRCDADPMGNIYKAVIHDETTEEVLNAVREYFLEEFMKMECLQTLRRSGIPFVMVMEVLQ